MIKMMIVGRRRAGMTLDEHHRYIKNTHGAMVVRFIEREPDHAPQRYAQNHVFDGTYRAETSLADPFALNRDFVTQVWFEDLQHAMASHKQPFYNEQLRPDEDNFVDQTTVVKFPVKEHQMVAALDGTARFKLFVFFKRATSAEPEQFGQACSRVVSSISSSPLAAKVRRHVRNEVLSGPGQVTPVDVVDEFWVQDAATAQELAALVREQMIPDLIATGAVQVGTTFFLLAEEFVLFAGNS